MRNTGKLKSDKTLGNGGSLGGGGKSLSARKRLRARSEKMQRTYEEERVPFVIDFLERHPACVFKLWIHGTTLEESPPINSDGGSVTRCGKRAVDVHEIVPRGRGGNMVPIDGQDELAQFAGLCRKHHTYVTQNPAFAKAKGYSR